MPKLYMTVPFFLLNLTHPDSSRWWRDNQDNHKAEIIQSTAPRPQRSTFLVR